MQNDNKYYAVSNTKKEIKQQLEYLEDYSYNEETKLLCLALDLSLEKLLIKGKINKKEYKKVFKIVKKRKSGRPLNKIFKKANFYYDELFINNSVLAPRKETEILVEQILKIINNGNKNKYSLLDLCCGSGAIGLEVAKHSKKDVDVVLSDISKKALRVTKVNQKRLNVKSNTKIIKSDMFNDLKIGSLFDIIASNPPYIETDKINNLSLGVIKYDPLISLDGGKDGLDFYRIIARYGKKYLKEDGYIICEIGFNQKEQVNSIFSESGFEVETLKDYDNNDRIIIAKSK